MTCDFHVHTDFSDGKNRMADVAAAAYARGMTALGFSDHGYAAYDTDCCMPREQTAAYRAACRQMQGIYAGRMQIWCGIEQDFFSDEPTDMYDYVIGSVHYIKLGGDYLCVDRDAETLQQAARRMGGSLLDVAAAYYALVAQVVEQTRCQLIGHFDLISKFNENNRLFDASDPRYIAAWQGAADALLQTGIPFEINTGAMSRGYRTSPYPADSILRYLHARGAQFVLSSDSHHKDTLMYDFPRQEQQCRGIGIVPLTELKWRYQ